MNYGRTVTLMGGWLRLSVLGDVIVRRSMSDGVRISAGQIILHVVIEPAGVPFSIEPSMKFAVVPSEHQRGHQTIVLHAVRLRRTPSESENRVQHGRGGKACR